MCAKAIRRVTLLSLAAIHLILPAGWNMPAAAAGPAEPFPFFSQIRCTPDGDWQSTLQTILPDVHAALNRVTATERLLRPAQIREIRMTGLLAEDTVQLCLFIYGDFDPAAIRAARPDDLREIGRIRGFPLYRLEPPAQHQPPIFLLFPQAGQMVAGRMETLGRVMNVEMPVRLPALFGEFTEASGDFRVFLQPPFFDALPARPPGDESYQALTELFGRVEAVALALDSLSGNIELLLHCREAGDAEQITRLLRNFIGLMLLSTAPEDQISGILKQCEISHRDGLVLARLRLPEEIRRKLFTGGSTGESGKQPSVKESPRP
ncbi:MAG: hypothetical protein JXQ27_08345 [Acidobacteria bacterium]|nr:hypothetical protein [Acidobacteriota bacterium]